MEPITVKETWTAALRRGYAQPPAPLQRNLCAVLDEPLTLAPMERAWCLPSGGGAARPAGGGFGLCPQRPVH